MKRNFNVIDGIFLVLLFCKLVEVGPQLSNFALIIPYLCEIAITILFAIAKVNLWDKKIEFWLWKIFMKKQVKKSAKKAASGANPGKHFDPEKTGK